MQLETTRFGAIDVDEDAIITFTHPIIGFQEFRRFVLLPGPKGKSVTWLQSTEAGDLAFLLIDPETIVPDYKVELRADELEELAAQDVSQLDVRTLLVVPQDKSQVRTNLKAPILINRKRRLGKQTILDHSDYPVRYFLADDRRTASQEVSNARTHA